MSPAQLSWTVSRSDGACLLLERVKGKCTRLHARRIWADSGYAGQLIEWVKTVCGWVLEIVKRSDPIHKFEVQPKRWIVERTFGWLNRSRRLSKHYERDPESSEAMVYIAMIHLMTKRLAGQQVRFVWH